LATNDRVDGGGSSSTLTNTQYLAGSNNAGGTQEKYALAPTSNTADVGKTSTSTANISTTGSSATNANLQPYVVVKMWKRTA
jgi:microcystin-dependent protein